MINIHCEVTYKNTNSARPIAIYSISSPIRHTCSVHVLSKILMRIYHIIVKTHISPQSKITKVHHNKKVIDQ